MAGRFLLVVALLLVVAGLIWVLVPRAFEQPGAMLLDVLGSLDRAEALPRLEGPSSEAMALAITGAGDVVAVTKYDVTRYVAGNPRDAIVLLDSRSYGDWLAGSLRALSTGAALRDDEIWVGSWYGQVLRYRGGVWEELSAEEFPPIGRIQAISEDADGSVYVGGRGLWRYDRAAARFEAVAGFEDAAISALVAVPVGGLLAATREQLFRLRAGSWQELWHIADDDREINAAGLRASGEILVGTHDGFHVLTASGEELSHELDGAWITGFAEDRFGDLWVASWQQGFFVRVGDGWTSVGYTEGLSEESLSALAVAGGDRLWLALYGGGVRVGRLQSVKKMIRGLDAEEPLPDLGRFASACEAAPLLGGAAESGAVAVVTVEGEPVVFFDGVQVCPKGVGHRRDRKAALVSRGGRLLEVDDGRVRALELPDALGAGRVTAALLDRRGRVWLGTAGSGLFRSEAGEGLEWQGDVWRSWREEAEMASNPIVRIVEDPGGDVWIGTSPPYDRASGRHRYAGLHRFAGERFTHLRPVPGRGRSFATGLFDTLPSETTTDLLVRGNGDLVVATNGGFTVRSAFGMRTFDAADGLESQFVHSISEDESGRLWMAHAFWGYGISYGLERGFGHVSSRQGLFDDRIDRVAVDGEGRVWLLATSGEVVVYERELLLRRRGLEASSR